MTNTKLIFTHRIPVEIFAQCDVSLEILINNMSLFKKQYSANEVHKEVLTFDHEYVESRKNRMTFMFSGKTEVEKKYLKILQICLNKQVINQYNSEYFPDINPEWWQNLSEGEKQKQNEIIYGKTGAEFGWYGEINFYYLAGFDYRSRFIYNRDNNDYTKLLGEKTDWVFIDENSVKTHNRIR